MIAEYKINEILSTEFDILVFKAKFYRFLVYRIYDVTNNKSYIGSTPSMYHRLFSNEGHITLMNSGNEFDLYKDMRSRLYDFNLQVIEFNSSAIEMRERETHYVKEYDSFNNGYNRTPDGHARNTEGKFLGFMHDKRWMTNGIEELAVKLDEINFYENLGYFLGRLKRTSCKKPKLGKLIHKDGLEIYVPESSLQNRLNNGWKLGHKDGFISKQKGKIRINNGIEEFTIRPDDLDKYPGYVQGGLPNPNKRTIGVTGRKVVNDGVRNYKIKPEDVDHYVNDLGMKLGARSYKKINTKKNKNN